MSCTNTHAFFHLNQEPRRILQKQKKQKNKAYNDSSKTENRHFQRLTFIIKAQG